MNRNHTRYTRAPAPSAHDIRKLLARWEVPAPPEAARRRAVSAALGRMPRWAPGVRHPLLRQIAIEARFLPTWYYAASVLLLAVGIAFVRLMPSADMRLGALMGMAPLPVLLGLLEVFRGSDQGMGEVECACRYSPARVISARMLLVGLLSCVAAGVMGLCLRGQPPLLVLAAVVVPFCMSAAAGLYLSSALHGQAGSAQIAAVVAFFNAVGALMLGANPRLVAGLTHLPLLMLSLLSMLALALAVRRLLRISGSLYERMVQQWI